MAPIKATQVSSPKEALMRLQQGNKRFVQGMISVESMLGIQKLRELAEGGQSPYAIVVCCSDSRVPVETVFDCGLGELFVIRVAGNIISSSVIASIEFAASSFNPQICVVMGHTRCGAITAALNAESGTQTETYSPDLERLLSEIRPSARNVINTNPGADIERLKEKTTLLNIANSVNALREQSPFLREMHQSGRMMITGALCDLVSGEVNLVDSEERPRLLSRVVG